MRRRAALPVNLHGVILLMDPAVLAGSGAPFADFVERFRAPGPALVISTRCSQFMYLVCMAAALQLRFGLGWASGAWLPWVAGLAVLYSTWTIYGAGGEAVAWGVLLLLASLPVYFVIGRSAGAKRTNR